MTDLIAALASLGAYNPDPNPRWDEGFEQQLSHAADTYDPETGRSRPLRRRTR